MLKTYRLAFGRGRLQGVTQPSQTPNWSSASPPMSAGQTTDLLCHRTSRLQLPDTRSDTPNSFPEWSKGSPRAAQIKHLFFNELCPRATPSFTAERRATSKTSIFKYELL